tara:strand:+ start:123 stop:272 length:150 start_codon:yes stop_codon:yes gene_type:complete
MGRKKLHRSKEELAEENRQRQRKFYWKNKDKLNAARMERYYKERRKNEQ